jgi:hypothetical protein
LAKGKDIQILIDSSGDLFPAASCGQLTRRIREKQGWKGRTEMKVISVEVTGEF